MNSKRFTVNAKRPARWLSILAALLLATNVVAADLAPVAINGTQLTVVQLRQLESQIGTRIAPGNYLVDGAGCWLNLSTGTSGCLGQGDVDVHSRYGSGSRSADGSWNHYSRAAGGAVGGTSDGCVYTTFGWSNC
ncbi:MAG: hypothetical protein AAGG11_03835 [Pseudomonadota bacterium]